MLSLAKHRIKTERLVLRSLVAEDAERIAELANHAEIAHNLATMPHPYGLEDAVEYVGKVTDMTKGAAFAVTLKPNDELIGICGYGPPAGEDYIDFGYWLGLDYWGKGYAREAAQGVVTHAFCIGMIDELRTDCRKDNPRSKRLLDDLGFITIGESERFSLGAGETAATDEVLLTCDDWLAARACAQTG